MLQRGHGEFRLLKRGCALAVALVAGLSANGALAKPGTHAQTVSTWDTRASSVTLGGLYGYVDGGHFHNVSYSANFTNTTGILSSQFGVHYVTLSEKEAEPTLHGVSGTATAVFNVPLTNRFDNGIPLVGLGLYVGGAPTVLISGKLNYLSIPIVAGFALNWSPVSWVTISPWFEGSVSLDLDTRFKAFDYKGSDASKYVTVDEAAVLACGNDQACIEKAVTINFTEQDAEKVVSDIVELQLGFNVNAKFGLRFGFHLTERFDLDVGATYSTIGAGFSGSSAVQAGANLVFRWDSIVPAVLPAKRRLESESCPAIEGRFGNCPQSFKWIRPEQAETAKACLKREKAAQEAKKKRPQAPPATTPAPEPAPSKPEPTPVSPETSGPTAPATPDAAPSAAPPSAAPTSPETEKATDKPGPTKAFPDTP